MRRPPGRRPRHAGYLLRRALNGVRTDALDRRSHVGCAVRKVVDDLVEQLGGADEVAPAMRILVEQTAIRVVITDAVGQWLLQRGDLVRADGDGLLKVATEHVGMQKALTLMLQAVGLDRRAVPVVDVRQEDKLDGAA
jgi:hypothetical protein